MSVLRLLIEEIRYRKSNFLLALLAVTAAATLFVAAPTVIEGYARQSDVLLDNLQAGIDRQTAEIADETRTLMRDMGFNLLIVHRDTNMADFWAADFSTIDMPQHYVQRLADDPRLTLVTHLVATLQQRIKWQGRQVLLVGYLPETTQQHMQEKAPMGYAVEPGTCFVGHELGLGRAEGETIDVLGKPLRIARILDEKGSKEDITIAVHLADAQAILNKPAKINQILALGCRCAGERLPKIRKQLEAVLPETRISEFESIALARAEQRDLVAREREQLLQQTAESRAAVQQTMETLAEVATPMVVLACAVWVGLLAYANARERRVEIGLLRALGQGAGRIAVLFLGKAILLGLLGALAGWALGVWLGQTLAESALDIAASHLVPSTELFLITLVGAPLLCALASYLPTLWAILQDPAIVLREA